MADNQIVEEEDQIIEEPTKPLVELAVGEPSYNPLADPNVLDMALTEAHEICKAKKKLGKSGINEVDKAKDDSEPLILVSKATYHVGE